MEKSPQSELWRIAMDVEIKNLKSREVWELVDPPSDKQVLRCRWVYNVKKEEDGKIIRHKSKACRSWT
ncbi:hypothetical protein TNCV_2136441 [Trichonephila clavipes]|nr:hypothetical protein TNCV_2136441 [Trichonephila clavipes]